MAYTPLTHYRPRDKVKRENRLHLRFTDAEYAKILKEATRLGVLPSSWAAEVLIAASTHKNK